MIQQLIRVNQQQVNVDGEKVGVNKPDIQYNAKNENGETVHHNEEYDTR